MCKISCPICLKPKEEKFLIYHLRKDHGKFKCFRCDFITSTNECLNSHLKTNHEFNHNCPICLKPKEEKFLIYHLRKDHGKLKCFRCDFITSEREGIQKHMKTHFKKYVKGENILTQENILDRWDTLWKRKRNIKE